jgi:hypothetical protein
MRHHSSSFQTLPGGVLHSPRCSGHDRPGTPPTPASTSVSVTIERENVNCGQLLFAFQWGVRTEISCSASSANTFAVISCVVERAVRI